MKPFNKFCRKPPFLFLVVIFAGLLLAACSGGAEPATATTATAPTTSESGSSIPEQAPETPEDPTPESTAPAADSDLANNTAEATAATGAAETTQAYPTRKPASAYADLQVVTLLPPDAIPAIDNPQFLTVEEADEFYDADELVMGVSFNGESRAYSAPFLSNHEIVNDTVGGVKIAVTW